MYCKNCGNALEGQNATYCVRCGTPVGQGNSYCEYCGSPTKAGETTCIYCGKPLGTGQNQQRAYQTGGTPYGSNPYQGQFNPQYNSVSIKYREIPLCILFTVFTCGIYGIYWFIQLTEDSNELANDHRTSGGMAFLFTLLTCGIYGFYWAYRLGEKIDMAKAQRGIPSSNTAVLYLILNILNLGIVTKCLAQNEINKFATE